MYDPRVRITKGLRKNICFRLHLDCTLFYSKQRVRSGGFKTILAVASKAETNSATGHLPSAPPAACRLCPIEFLSTTLRRASRETTRFTSKEKKASRVRNDRCPPQPRKKCVQLKLQAEYGLDDEKRKSSSETRKKTTGFGFRFATPPSPARGSMVVHGRTTTAMHELEYTLFPSAESAPIPTAPGAQGQTVLARRFSYR